MNPWRLLGHRAPFVLGAEWLNQKMPCMSMVLYLSPGDYHRVHSLVSGQIKKCTRIAGTTNLPVKPALTSVSPVLMTNERLIIEYCNPQLPTMVLVGATNVTSRIKPLVKGGKVNVGQELALFELGSTVVCIFPPGFAPKRSKMAVRPGQVVDAGETLWYT